MPDEDSCRKPLQPSRSSDSKKRRKKRKKTPAAITPSKDPVKPPAGSLRGSLPPPPTQPPARPAQPRSKLSSGHSGAIAPSKRHQRNSACGSEAGARAGENLRWEGALEDPRAEEERLEAYRANRRQRYIAHREALLRDAMKTVSPNNQTAKKNTC